MLYHAVLEFIFIESPHAELIKRSLELWYVRSKDVKKQILTSIWSTHHPNAGQNIQHMII